MAKPARFNLISWNVSEKAATIESVASLLNDGRFSTPVVICLQEVPERLMASFRQWAAKRGMNICFGLDKHRQLKDKSTRDCYLVILSELPITDYRAWIISDTSRRPFIARVAIWALRKLRMWDDTALASGALGVTVKAEERQVNIITAHLSLTSPSIRQKEFDSLIARVDGTSRIICGDFNILEGLRGRVVNFLIGGSMRYALLPSERREFDKRLDGLGLRNPLEGRRTHSAGQLDHILYSHGLMHAGWQVLPRQNSDHAPIRVGFKAY